MSTILLLKIVQDMTYIIMYFFNFEGLKSGTGKSGSGERIGGNCKSVSILKPLLKGINPLVIA